jgi:tRNA-2-methylthio-N6-dimethylallyladenosine synthase
VLFERHGRRDGQLVGKSPYLQPVHIDAPASLIGGVAAVTITGLGSNSLFGALTQPPVLPVQHADLVGAGA